jgi:cell division control protein 7
MATFFSQHSSNPLEVSSSDVHNTRRLRMLEACGGVGSSDEDYTLTHSGEGTASGWTAKTLTGKESKESVPLMIDLDEDMSDEDTLACEPGMGTAGEADADAEEEEEEETQVDEQVDDEDEEERTILLKPPDEQEQIAEEILDLEEAVPQLREDYKIVDRLGTGTFSSVYKAIDLWYHSKWYNTPWLNMHPPSSPAYYQSEPRPKGSKAFVAIKRIYVTSGPDRIRNEISIMDDCRGCRHVSQLVTAFRHRDQIVVVMPYHKNDDFRVSGADAFIS